MKIKSKGCHCQRLEAASPSFAVITSQPNFSSSRRVRVRLTGLSSTNRTFMRPQGNSWRRVLSLTACRENRVRKRRSLRTESENSWCRIGVRHDSRRDLLRKASAPACRKCSASPRWGLDDRINSRVWPHSGLLRICRHNRSLSISGTNPSSTKASKGLWLSEANRNEVSASPADFTASISNSWRESISRVILRDSS